MEEDGVETPGRTKNAKVQTEESFLVPLQYQNCTAGGDKSEESKNIGDLWISPKEVDFMDGWEHNGHLTVALEKTETLSTESYIFQCVQHLKN